ncbi:MAG: 30S ribosomal protein S6 [Candidatus Saccharimonadales bacterium]
MNIYEVAVLYDPQLEIDLSKAESKIEKIITENKGKITKMDNWGKRKLAYKVGDHDNAIYVFYTVELPGENVVNVEKTLNITDEVIRFLITRPDLKAIAKAETAKKIKAQKVAERGDSGDNEKDGE